MVRRLGKKIAADFGVGGKKVRKGRQVKCPLTPLEKRGGKLKTGLDRAGVIGYKSPLPGRRQGWPGGAGNKPN